MKKIDDNIYFYPTEKNKGILKYPKCNIEQEAYIGKNGLTNEKEEGDQKTPIGKFELGIILNTQKNGKNKNIIKDIEEYLKRYWVR